MDIAGNNRYELLYMDEESASLPVQGETGVNKMENPNPASRSTKKTKSNKKAIFNVEKENKCNALNVNETIGKVAENKPKACLKELVLKHQTEDRESRRIVYESKSSVLRKETTRKFREAPPQYELSNERGTRQFRDRNNRGPARELGFRGGKREFDRQSGSDKTGVKAVDKRDGAGAHNWGSVKQEINDLNKSTTDADATLTDKEESTNEPALEQCVATEEEIKELTLDEWRALCGVRTKPQYNIRKPNEGEDTSQWKKMVVLNKKQEGDSEEEYEYDPSMYPQRVGRLQRIVDIQFNFKDGRRGGVVRGRGRGPRPGGEKKGLRLDSESQKRDFDEKQQQLYTNALKVDDENQFPTLS